MFLKNKGKLIAKIMAVCCAFSTSTFFNMHGMAAQKEVIFKDSDDPTQLLGPNLVATITHQIKKITNNVGLITYKIDCSEDYSTARLNEVLTKLAIKKESENGDFIAMSDLVKGGVANAPVEIYNVGQLFNDGNSLIKFSISAKKDSGFDVLIFETKETTDPEDQVINNPRFSVYRIESKKPTIQYDTSTHTIKLNIHVNLPEKYKSDSGQEEDYKSFSVTATINDSNTLEDISAQSGV